MINNTLESEKKSILFLSDIDGTLIKTRENISRELKSAIESFIRRGNFFAFSTGRSLCSAEKLVRDIPVNAPCILCGGAVIYDYVAGHLIKSYTLPEDINNLLGEIMNRFPEVSVTLTNVNTVYNIRMNARLLARGVEEDAGAPLERLENVIKPVKAMFTSDCVEDLQRIQREFFTGDDYSFSFASKHFCEVTSGEVDKGKAVKKLSELYGGCFVCTAGDAMSDVSMADYANLFFVPETALAEVKQRSDYIIASPAENGIINAFAIAEEVLNVHISEKQNFLKAPNSSKKC